MLQDFQCSNCRLVFTEQKHLNTHKVKFCQEQYPPGYPSNNNFAPRESNQSFNSKRSNVSKRSFEQQDSLTSEMQRRKQNQLEKMRLNQQLKALQQEQDKLIQISQFKRPQSQTRQIKQYNALKQSKVSEVDQFMLDHGKKMAEIKLKRQGYQNQNQSLARKLREVNSIKERQLPLQSFTYKDIKGSNVSQSSSYHKPKLDASVIQNRKANLRKLQQQYQNIGGNDPAFYNSIARLQSKYNLEAQRALQLIPKQPPKQQNNWMLPFPSKQILPEGTFSEYQPLLIGQTLNKQQTVQQRVVASIMAQQYDSLQMLAKIPKNSELYKVKLQQYKDLSKYRQQALKQAHLQRLKKLKNQFQLERKLDIKQFNNEKWVNEMRKNIINKVKKTGPGTGKMSCGVFIHMVKGMPKSVYQIRINFKVVQNSMVLLQDNTLGQRQSKSSATDGKFVSLFNQIINLTTQDKLSLNVLIQVSCNSIGNKQFRQLGWSFVKLTNARSKVLQNNYKLPVFEYAIDHNVYLNRGKNRRVFPQMFVYLKVFERQMNDFREYIEPRYQKQQIFLDDQNDEEALDKNNTSIVPRIRQNQNITNKKSVGMKSAFDGTSLNREYLITVLSLTTSEDPQSLIFQLSIYAGDQILYSRNNEAIRYQFQLPFSGNKHSKKKNIALNQQLRVSYDLQTLYASIQKDIYLMMILKDKNQEQDSNIVGWHCYKLTNFHKVRQGDVIVKLVNDDLQQIPYDMNLALSQTDTQIHLRLDWCEQQGSRQSRRQRSNY